jgi:hypothetical protein
MARKKPKRESKTAKQVANQAAALAEYAAKALVAAEQLRVKSRPVEGLQLSDVDRAALALLPNLSPKLKKQLAKPDAAFTVAEVAGIIMAVAEAFLDAQAKQQVGMLLVGRKLMDCLQANIVMPDLRPIKAAKATLKWR